MLKELHKTIEKNLQEKNILQGKVYKDKDESHESLLL